MTSTVTTSPGSPLPATAEIEGVGEAGAAGGRLAGGAVDLPDVGEADRVGGVGIGLAWRWR